MDAYYDTRASIGELHHDTIMNLYTNSNKFQQIVHNYYTLIEN